MAVAHDGETRLEGETAAGTSHAFGNKTTAGSSRLGIVHIRLGEAAFASEPASVTWGGTNITSNQIGSGISFGSGDTGGVRSYYMINPPTGSTAVAATTTGSTAVGFCVTSFNGVDQVTPIDTGGVQTASGTSTTPSVTVSVASGNAASSVVTAGNIYSSNGSGQVQDGEWTDGGGYVARATHEISSGSVVMDYTLAGSASWATQAFEINAAATGAALSIATLIQNYRNMGYMR